MQNLSWSMQISFHEWPNRISLLGNHNEANATFFFPLDFKKFYEKVKIIKYHIAV